MNVFRRLGTGVRKASKVGMLKVKAKSPELLMILGAGAFVATVVLACKETLACEEILDQHEEKMKNIEEALSVADEYTEDTAKKDKAIAYIQTTGKMAKNYAPAILCGVISISSFLCAYGILKKRNIGLSMAYAALNKGFNDYRDRVRKELGDDADQKFRYGYETIRGAKLVTGKDENGNDIVEEKDIDTVPWDEEVGAGENRGKNWNGHGKNPDGTFLFAPETSHYFQEVETLNDITLSQARNTSQIDLDAYGHLFLNNVLRKLGMDEIPEGQLVGWIHGKGDPYIDFRVKKIYRQKKGYGPGIMECVYLLDFNTAGEIYQCLGSSLCR